MSSKISLMGWYDNEYAAYGNTISSSGSLKNEMKFRFSSKYFDAEINAYNYGYRFYHPDTGRWFSRDPIEEDGGLLLYGYCGNEPIGKWDILGLHTDADAKSIALKRIGQAKDEVRGTYFEKHSGYINLLRKLRHIVDWDWAYIEFGSMGPDHEYNQHNKHIYWHDKAPSISAVFHELTHVYSFHNKAELAMMNHEGLGYYVGSIYNAINTFIEVDKALASTPVNIVTAENNWRYGWKKADYSTYYAYDPVTESTFPVVDDDVVMIESMFGFRLKCSDMANYYNKISEGKNCCLRFACDESTKFPGFTVARPDKQLNPPYQ